MKTKKYTTKQKQIMAAIMLERVISRLHDRLNTEIAIYKREQASTRAAWALVTSANWKLRLELGIPELRTENSDGFFD